ncbi:MAG: NADH-quinone oxidoreductase subunit M [Bifidobacteriaceae bacterium]|jgi:NADH-quinone oxidoreductase subunit M|nr:NADH-quinone oxidoreductase subunit M [Bifidobacteriaceae bacterium]
MQNFPWLTALIAAPALGGLILWLVPRLRRAARAIALGWSVAVFAGAVAAAAVYLDAEGAIRLAEQHSWIKQFGISYAVGVGGLGLMMILLSTLLVPIVLLAAWKQEAEPSRQAHYAALVLVLESFMIAVFAARDVVLFYVFFEAMLIPVYFLIGSFGGEHRKQAALKFLLYSLAGGLVMLAGVIALGAAQLPSATSFTIDSLSGAAGLDQTAERLVFLSFFTAFAVKAPMFPLHSWLPDAAQAAKPGTSVLLVGVLDKVGTFGMMTLCLPLFPNAARWAAPVVIALAVVSVLWGALLALGQKDLFRMIAYTSVSHFGFIVLGIFAFSQTSEIGSGFYMLNHGLSTGALFLVAGFLASRRGTQRIDQLGGGLQRTVPVLAGVFLVVGLSAIALPGLSTFVSEFMVIAGAFQTNAAAAVIAALGVILAALYILIAYQKIFTGPVREDLALTPDLGGRELWAVGPLIALMLVLGFYPSPALDVLRDDAAATVQSVTAPAAPRASADPGAAESAYPDPAPIEEGSRP